MSDVPLFRELRARAFEVTDAVEVLGKTSGVFASTGEYVAIQGRASAWRNALLLAANMVAARYEPEELAALGLAATPTERGASGAGNEPDARAA